MKGSGFSAEAHFDPETGLDIEDPAGSITLSDGRNRIHYKFTFLDSWLLELSRAAVAIRTAPRAVIYIPEERSLDLEITVRPDGSLGIRSLSATSDDIGPLQDRPNVAVASREEFESVVRTAAKPIIEALMRLEGWQRNPSLVEIADFVCRGPMRSDPAGDSSRSRSG